MDFRRFGGGTLQDAAHGALAAAQRESPPFDLVLFEADSRVSDCGLVPSYFRYDQGGLFGEETVRWKQIQAFFSKDWESIADKTKRQRILVISTSSRRDIEARCFAARGWNCPGISVWTLELEKGDLRGCVLNDTPPAEPKLGQGLAACWMRFFIT